MTFDHRTPETARLAKEAFGRLVDAKLAGDLPAQMRHQVELGRLYWTVSPRRPTPDECPALYRPEPSRTHGNECGPLAPTLDACLARVGRLVDLAG